MTDRERFLRTFRFQPVDRIPWWDFGFWDATLERWFGEGLPRGANIDEYFGMDKQWRGAGVNLGLLPPFDEEVLEEDAHTRTVRDSEGVVCIKTKDGTSIPKYIEFPVKTREDFVAMKKRYDPSDPKRYPADWEKRIEQWKTRDYPLMINCLGFFGTVRGWMGLENACMAFHDDPKWMHEMMEFIGDFIYAALQRALGSGVGFDWGHFWEDMCYNKASLISPAMFREFMLPQYKRVTGLCRRHGVEFFVVDCDGNVEELIPLWHEGGVKVMFPMEQGTSANDIFRYRKEYGKDALMIGGIDKHRIAEGRRAIEDEVDSKLPLMEEGGYIPTPDHRVPPTVSLDNYRYYVDYLKRRTSP
jgi:uroporphyrinogen-III decarboxylase